MGIRPPIRAIDRWMTFGKKPVIGSEHAAQQERAIPQRLEYAGTTLRWHEVILCWIEQCRLAMYPLPPTPVEKGGGDQNSPSKRQRRSKRRDPLAVLGKVGVSKSTPNCQNIGTRTFKATIFKPISVDSAVTIPTSTQQQQIPKRREISLDVPKRRHLANFSHGGSPRQIGSPILGPNRDQGYSAAATGRFEIEQGLNASRPLSSHSKPRTIKTRSQRISREPVRWVPE
ncbi:MAG: hypothetical protein M1816_002652 [Peltula sp. TS41687]|nr:MAG: hypothetical protein M1816_002652 [Peltula sp. TS41687]